MANKGLQSATADHRLTLATLSIKNEGALYRVQQKNLFLEYFSTAKARCSTDKRSMATEMLCVSLEGRSKTNSPRQQFQSQLCCQIISYFCQTLYVDCQYNTEGSAALEAQRVDFGC